MPIDLLQSFFCSRTPLCHSAQPMKALWMLQTSFMGRKIPVVSGAREASQLASRSFVFGRGDSNSAGPPEGGPDAAVQVSTLSLHEECSIAYTMSRRWSLAVASTHMCLHPHRLTGFIIASTFPSTLVPALLACVKDKLARGLDTWNDCSQFFG